MCNLFGFRLSISELGVFRDNVVEMCDRSGCLRRCLGVGKLSVFGSRCKDEILVLVFEEHCQEGNAGKVGAVTCVFVCVV